MEEEVPKINEKTNKNDSNKSTYTKLYEIRNKM
jgi:hypothetical protein